MKNCFIVSPPFSGARVLAEHLVKQHGYNSGSDNLPSLLDPSQSSYEDKWIDCLNMLMCSFMPAFSGPNRYSWATPMPSEFSVDVDTIRESTYFDRVMQMLSSTPYVIKDPNASRLLCWWLAVTQIDFTKPGCPELIFLVRHPNEFVQSMADGARRQLIPTVLLNTDVGLHLWFNYTVRMHIMYESMPPSIKEHSWWFLMPQMCEPETGVRIQQCLGLKPSTWPFNKTRIRHVVDPVTSRIPCKACRQGWQAMEQHAMDTKYRMAVVS